MLLRGPTVLLIVQYSTQMAAGPSHTPPPGSVSVSVSGPGLSAAFSDPDLPQQYRIVLGLNMDGYITPGIEEAYRLNNMQSGAANANANTNANAAPTTSGQFGILAPATLPESSEAQPAIGASNTPSQGYEQQVKRSNGQLSTKIVIDPPNLEEWRNKLFNVDETIVLTHEE